jgi:hypothetical protein
MQFIRTAFASSVMLDENQVFNQDLNLGQIMLQSESLHNSVDLMEAFAKVANQVKRNYGVRVKLPAFPLETKISEVLTIFVAEIERGKSVNKASPSADRVEEVV